MLIPSLLILFLLFTPFTHAYTVITLSGKRVQGKLVSEQTSTILIKDTEGVLISFKKQSLDWDAMRQANLSRLDEVQKLEKQPSRKTAPSLVEIATQAKQHRTGTARSLKIEDLAKTPELSVMGADIPLPTGKSSDQPDEQKWGARLGTLKKEVNRLQERQASAQLACDQSKQKQYQTRTTGHEQPSNLLLTYKETPQCSKLKQIEIQIGEAQMRLEDAQEEGRRAGVSWQTLE